MADDLTLDPESIEALRAFTEETVAKRAGRPRGRTASQVINEDPSPRPYSVRLTAREIHKLRVLARATSQKPSELVRQFILDGMLRLEARVVERPAEVEGQRRIMDIKLALLSAYDLVEGLDHAQTPTP